jgi:hypothetical protein
MVPRGLRPPIPLTRRVRVAWYTAVIAVAVIGLVVLALSHQRASPTVTITVRDAGRTIHLRTGQGLVISLPRTAIGWSAWVSDSSVLSYKSEGTTAYSPDSKSQIISMPATANGTAILVVCPGATCSASQADGLRFTVQVGA